MRWSNIKEEMKKFKFTNKFDVYRFVKSMLIGMPHIGHQGFPGRVVRNHMLADHHGAVRFHRNLPFPPLDPPHEFTSKNQKSWPPSYNLGPGTHIYDFRNEDTLSDLPDENNDWDVGWLHGLPKLVWKPQNVEDMEKLKNNFWGRFDSPNDWPYKDRAKRAVDEFGYANYYGIRPSNQLKQLPPKDYLGHVEPPNYVRFCARHFSDSNDAFKHEVEYQYPKGSSSEDSEGEFDMYKEEKPGCFKYKSKLMYLDRKLSHFETVAVWHRIQVGVSLVKICQTLIIIYYIFLYGEMCPETDISKKIPGEKLGFPCNYIKAKPYHLMPYYLIYFAIIVPVIGTLPLAMLPFWYQCFRWITYVLFAIHTTFAAHISATIYISIPRTYGWWILYYHFSQILTQAAYVLYFLIKYDSEFRNQLYWDWFMGNHLYLHFYRFKSFKWGGTDTRGGGHYSSAMRQSFWMYEFQKWAKKSYRTKQRIAQNMVAYYVILSNTLFKWLCNMDHNVGVWFGTFICNFWICTAESAFHLWFMHHFMIFNDFKRYNFSDVLMMAMLS